MILLAARYFYVHRMPKLTAEDSVVLADFTNTTGDPIFDDTLKPAISVHLAQSPFLNILSNARIRSTLKLMAKPSGTRLTPEIASDLCERLGGKAYILRSIANLGSQYVIGLDAINCKTGDPLAQEQVTLARLQLGRAYALQGDSGQSRGAYQDFFQLWKDADLDIPILIVAKSEYAKLK